MNVLAKYLQYLAGRIPSEYLVAGGREAIIKRRAERKEKP